MIFDNLGLPKDNGATDLQDSARLAGLMTVFGWPKEIPLSNYLSVSSKSVSTNSSQMISTKRYVRHPLETKYDFSRDQAICLMAGFYCGKYLSSWVDKKFVDGKDFFSPSHMGHVRVCQGLAPRWYQKLWLWFDVLYSCFYQPMGEPNQILCMLMVADKKYLKFWLKYNKHWRDAIREYWCEGAGEWRGERELAEHMIKVLESKV